MKHVLHRCDIALVLRTVLNTLLEIFLLCPVVHVL